MDHALAITSLTLITEIKCAHTVNVPIFIITFSSNYTVCV